jgi:hypothetical protein
MLKIRFSVVQSERVRCGLDDILIGELGFFCCRYETAMSALPQNFD